MTSITSLPVAVPAPATIPGLNITAEMTPAFAQILTPDALKFFVRLARKFEPTRQTLLAKRDARQKEFDAGLLPDLDRKSVV